MSWVTPILLLGLRGLAMSYVLVPCKYVNMNNSNSCLLNFEISKRLRMPSWYWRSELHCWIRYNNVGGRANETDHILVSNSTHWGKHHNYRDFWSYLQQIINFLLTHLSCISGQEESQNQSPKRPPKCKESAQKILVACVTPILSK